MYNCLAWIGFTLLAANPASQSAPPPPDTLVIGPREFLDAFQPWVVHRTQQGHRLGFLSSEFSAQQLRDAIRQTAKSGVLKTIVLLGDADPAAVRNAAIRSRCTPTQYVPAKVNIRWGSEPEIASDNWFADLNGDEVPDLAIGRLTADSPDELGLIVQKILAYERSDDYGAWRQRINLVAGLGGFGELADSVLEAATKKFVTAGIPSGYSTSVTYGSWQSPYCPDPRFFHQTALRRLNEGCLFWVYIGHGQQYELDRIRVPGSSYPILSNRDITKVESDAGLPIAVFLACYTAAFDQSRDCLAEELLRAPRGPVAVLGGSRVTMPYAMSILGMNLMEECFQQQPETLGQMILQAKRGLIRPDPSLQRKMLDTIASLLSPDSEMLDEERKEHLHLFNLIGDPLLRIRQPLPLQLTEQTAVDAGIRLSVSGTSPLAGRCTVELVCRRDELRFTPPSRTEFIDTDAVLAGYSEVYQQANLHRWTSREFQVKSGQFSTELDIPPDAHGSCHLRVYVDGGNQHAIGSTELEINPPIVAVQSQSSR